MPLFKTFIVLSLTCGIADHICSPLPVRSWGSSPEIEGGTFSRLRFIPTTDAVFSFHFDRANFSKARWGPDPD